MDQDVVRLPEDAAMELIRKLAGGVSRKVQQIVPLTASHGAPQRSPDRGRVWPSRIGLDVSDATVFSQAVSETLAKLGREVSRIYLVPRGLVRAKAVDERVTADWENGVDSRSLRLSEVDAEPDLQKQTPVSPVWIVDDCAVMYQEATEHGPQVWAVSAREADVRQASALWDLLWKKSDDSLAAAEADPDEADPDEELNLRDPLAVSAEQMAITARLYCTRGNGTEERCDWYHGAWPYLRLFDMVSSPQWHHSFYNRELRRHVKAIKKRRRAEPRILITGAADYSMLAYVLDALDRSAPDRAPSEAPEVDVLDMCPTPLLTCRWYARTTGHRVRVHEQDLFDEDSIDHLSGRFDLIATDAFLTRFSVEDSATVVRRWRDLLAPGGVVVTTVRVHGADDGADRFDQIADFAQRAQHSARRWRSFFDASVEDVVNEALDYAHQITSTDLGGRQGVESLFTANGFTVVKADPKEVPGELQTPTTYLQVLARKEAVPDSTP